MIELWQCAADARAATEPAEFVRLLEKAARLAARLPEFEERLKPSKSLVALLNGLQKAARGRAGEIRGAGLDERMSEVLERIRNVRTSATPAPAVG